MKNPKDLEQNFNNKCKIFFLGYSMDRFYNLNFNDNV